MRRLNAFDRALLLVLLPVWLLSWLLALSSAVRDTAYSPFFVAASEEPGGHPTIAGIVPGLGGEDAALQPGDRLVRIGSRDLGGAGPIRVYVTVAEQAGSDSRFDVVYVRDGLEASASLVAGSHVQYWPALVASLVFAVSGIVILLRAPSSEPVRRGFQAFVCAAILFSAHFHGTPPEAYAQIALHLGAMTLAGPLVVRLALSFPSTAEHRWAERLPWLFLLLGPLEASRVYAFPLDPEVGGAGSLGAMALILLILVLGLTRAYLRAGPIPRRQIKWVLLGTYLSAAPIVVASLLAAIDPRYAPAFALSALSLVFLPASVVVAVARYDLFDVDRLITATATYNLVLAVGGGIALFAVPRMASTIAGAVGADPLVGRNLISFLLLAALLPAGRQLQPWLERRMFRERAAFAQGIDRILAELSDCSEPRDLLTRTGEALLSLLRPERCAIYASAGDVFATALARGGAILPEISSDAPLLAALRHHNAPVSVDVLKREVQGLSPDPGDVMVLESLRAEILLPISLGSELVAVLTLGAKRSGDIYTPTDAALLGRLGDCLAAELHRFEYEELLRQSRTMHSRLGRYVPGAVARQIDRGVDLEPAESEVSVLFVDIRGYSTLAEGRAPDEIFALVSSYTLTVSELVQKLGGSVVEFNGDGMMAVFGAPDAHDRKEHAAVEAGREMVAAVAKQTVPSPEGRAASLSVGVGIASGIAMVGNIRAADRLIWTVLGNTTNLAARLQALTRELDAAIAIDAATWRAGGEPEDFTHRGAVAIRGRSELEDVYALPLSLAQRGGPLRLGAPALR